MAIIYSYPTVTPTTDDLVLGTDVNQSDKPTKNFTISSIIDLVTAGATGLGAVLKLDNSAKDPVAPFTNQSAIDFLNITGTGILTFPTINSTNIVNTAAITTASLTATGAVTGATLNGILAAGSSIAGLAGGTAGQNVLGVTQNAGDNSTRLATTAYVDSIVDPSVLTFVGTTGGNQTVTLATETFNILGTTSEIKTLSSAQTIAVSLADGAFGSGAELILPDGASAITQALADDTVKVATTAFVQQENDAQDLDFSGTAGTGSVILGGGSAQVFAVTGTASQIETTAAGQSLAIALTSSVQIAGTYTGTTFAGDLNGTVNTATTGVTQAAGDDSTLMATTAYVDAAAGAKILQYQGDTGGPFDLNLEDDDLDIAGGSNISTTAATVAANLGVITIDLDDSVTISGTMTADTFETTAGTATWSTTVMTGFTSITSTLFIGALQGNADSATALAATGSIGFGGEVTLTSATPSAVYTSGGSITFNLDLVNAAVTGQVLTGLPTPAAASITAGDTILSAFGKTQSQINSIANGLQFQGTWNATTNSPTLASGGGEATSGTTDGATTTDKLIDSTANFTATVTIGDKVVNQVDGQTALVSAIDSATVLSIDTDIMLTGEAYTIDNTPFITQGHYYVVSVAGSTSLNGISTWVIGDWVIAGATNVWEKLDGTAVQGTGTDNYLTKWNGTGVSIIVDSGVTDDGSTIKLLNDVELGTAASDTTIVKGPATFDGNIIMTTGTGVSLPVGTYGVAGQVLTAPGTPGTGTPLVWSTPTEGVVESVSGLYGITDGGTAADVTIAVTSDVNNLINQATLKGTPLGADSILINDSADTNTLKKSTIASLPFDDYSSWDLDGDSGSAQAISSGNTATFGGGTYITTVVGATDTLTINHDATTRSDTNTVLTPAFGDSVDAIYSLTTNATGHVTATTYGLTIPATVFTDSVVGLVPTPAETGTTKFLRQDQTWVVPPYSTYTWDLQTDSGAGAKATVNDSDVVILTSGNSTLDVTNSGLSASINMPNTGTAGTYTSVTTDAAGRVTAGTNPGGSGGGIFSGDQAIVTGSSDLTFTLTRATTGTLIFDVWFTSETSTATSLAKKYVVAHSHSTTPVYNKIIDTGPDGSNNFTVVFANSDTGAVGTSVTCSIQAVGIAQNIGYTIQVGHDSANALTFTAAS